MKVTSERLEDCQVKIRVELEAAEVEKRLRDTARKLSRDFNVPGYRRGKAPYSAIVRTFGREAVQQQGIEDWGNDLYEMAMKEVDVEPYEVGELQDVEWDPFVMTVLVPLQPEVDLGDYRSVRVPFEAEEITDEKVEEALVELQERYAQWVPVERPAEYGDQVVLDMEGRAGDKVFMSNQEHEMVLEEGATYPITGFHAEVVGLSAGEDKTFTLTVPKEDEDQEAAGQEGTVTVHVHSVKVEELAPLDDDLALMVGDYDTLADLRIATRQNLETEASQKADAEYLDKVFDAMVEAAPKIEYPAQAVDHESDMALSQMERNLASSGIEFDTYLRIVGKTRESYAQELYPVSEKRLQRRLVLTEVVSREKLRLEDDEIKAEIDRLVESMGEQGDEMREMLESPMGRMSIAEDLMIQRVQERIVQIAKGEAPPLEEEETEPETEPEAADDAEGAPEASAEEIGADEALESETD